MTTPEKVTAELLDCYNKHNKALSAFVAQQHTMIQWYAELVDRLQRQLLAAQPGQTPPAPTTPLVRPSGLFNFASPAAPAFGAAAVVGGPTFGMPSWAYPVASNTRETS